ncbi:hypothetical protein [Niallia sp. 03133]|uniref:hypothetical protein n=1 Tax=Niallia sp. 03133 TaxID=3458060 RepID=UPI004043F181
MHKDMESILENWVEKIKEDEFYLAHSFDRLIDNKSSMEAFEYIPHMLDAILETNDDFIASQLIFYTNCMYGKANTTELHPVFVLKLEELESHIHHIDGNHSKREYEEMKRDLRMT